jgi:anti-sigma factor RsiW
VEQQEELRHELAATLAARQETGHALEPQLVERFADKVEKEIERRAQQLAAQRRPSHSHNAPMIPLALGSLGLAIPLIAIAGGTAGTAGVIAVCIAIVLVNLLWTVRR